MNASNGSTIFPPLLGWENIAADGIPWPDWDLHPASDLQKSEVRSRMIFWSVSLHFASSIVSSAERFVLY